MAYGAVTLTEDRVAILTLNRPAKLNAVNLLMLTEIKTIMEKVRDDDNIRALVITGADPAFCSGADVDELVKPLLTGGPSAAPRTNESVDPLARFILPVSRMAKLKPTIAAVNGVTAGAGLSLAAACDIRIASEKATFMSAFIRRGLTPDNGLTYFLPRIVGMAKALEIMLTGDTIDAKAAVQIGLVNRVVPHADLINEARKLGTRIAEGPPLAIQLTKRAAYRGVHSDLETQLDLETHMLRLCAETEDFKEGIKAFLEKRKPIYGGK